MPPRWGCPWQSVAWSEATEAASISSLDIGIMPLVDEPFERGKCGYKLIQYMACGLPVVASPVGVNRQIVEHGVNGFLAETPAQWEEALRTLLGDAALRQRMGQAGRRQVEEKYCLQVTGPRLAELLVSASGTIGNECFRGESKIQSLQVFRGLAATAVVAHHANLSTAAFVGVVPRGVSDVFNLGLLGVDFFFVLSGFIIMYAHLDDVTDMGRGEEIFDQAPGPHLSRLSADRYRYGVALCCDARLLGFRRPRIQPGEFAASHSRWPAPQRFRWRGPWCMN